MPVPVFRCPICGSTLVRRDERAACTYCGAEDGSYGRGGLAPWRCPEGHWLCEECRTATAKDLPGRVVGSLGGQDPFAIAELLMAHPAMRQETYGPDFHAIPPLSLLIALRNTGAWKGSDARILAAAMRRERIVCSFSASKPDCKGERCPYHPAAGGGDAKNGA